MEERGSGCHTTEDCSYCFVCYKKILKILFNPLLKPKAACSAVRRRSPSRLSVGLQSRGFRLFEFHKAHLSRPVDRLVVRFENRLGQQLENCRPSFGHAHTARLGAVASRLMKSGVREQSLWVSRLLVFFAMILPLWLCLLSWCYTDIDSR